MKQGCQLSPFLFNHTLGIPNQSNKKGRRNGRNRIGTEVVKLSLFADDMILFLKDPKSPPKTS
jgi:hypothetical protein